MGTNVRWNPANAGEFAQKYHNWYMANIINEFVPEGMTLHQKLALRKALLVSYEVTSIGEGVRFNV